MQIDQQKFYEIIKPFKQVKILEDFDFPHLESRLMVLGNKVITTILKTEEGKVDIGLGIEELKENQPKLYNELKKYQINNN